MNTHSDVLIIGGGVIGLTCAYYIAKAGRGVRIIEQDRIGTGASHGNCGLIVSSHIQPLCLPGTISTEFKRFFQGTSPLYIKLQPDFDRFLWLLKFARKCNNVDLKHAIKTREGILHHSELLYDTLFLEEKLNADWEKKGVLMVYKSESGMAKYARTNAYLQEYGLEATPYVGDALFNLEPALREDVYGGWYHSTDTHLRPDKYLDELKTILIQKGVAIEENRPLTHLDCHARQITGAVVPNAVYTADHYVLATGAWTPEIVRSLKLKLPMQPAKGYSITMGRPALCPQIPCYLSEKSVVATPWKSGYRLGGTMEFSGFNFEIVPKRIQHLKETAREYLKDPLGDPVYEEWVGLRPMIYDDLPVIGWAPAQNNLMLATGHGMIGLSTAPSTGKLVAEMITGSDTHIDPAPFRIERFYK